MAPACCTTIQRLAESLFLRLSRRKSVTHALTSESKLAKCLSTFDLTALGVASTLCSGLYVITGQVARSDAGPSVVLSFLVAGITSVFAGLCYAEFGARVPKSGSAYVYSYVTVGEFIAFVIGWNLVLEYVIGGASVARALSSYIDAMAGHVISESFRAAMPINVSTLSPYPDWLAFCITMFLAVIVCFGIRESSFLNNLFTIVNLFVVAYVIICGLFWVDGANWNIPAEQVPPPKEVNGVGGFFPFGVQGMMTGAATCFYAFVGFDIIAITGEETVNPQKSIPIAIMACLATVALAYISTAIILTLMVPYYMLDGDAALQVAFDHVGWYVAGDIIGVGAIISLLAGLLTTVCAMPRIVFAMASDGLLFRCLAITSERFKSPYIATIVSGLATALLAMLLELSELVNLMSIGTLLAYTLVSVCVILLRYEDDQSEVTPHSELPPDTNVEEKKHRSLKQIFVEIFVPSTKLPSASSCLTVKISIVVMGLCTLWLCLVVTYAAHDILSGAAWAIVLVVFPILIITLMAVIIWRQPQQHEALTFQVPLVPLIPCLSLVCNLYLMFSLPVITWIRFTIWMIMGFIIYFGYGMWHNGEHIRKRDQYVELPGANGVTPSTSSTTSETPVEKTPSINGDIIPVVEKVQQSDEEQLVKSEVGGD